MFAVTPLTSIVRFYPDIYGHGAALARALERAPWSGARATGRN
jgi:hypothetical protein